MIYLNKILILVLLIIFSINANQVENKIIFQINNKAFTDIDIERRIKYIEIINNTKITENEINKKEIIDDYISSLIFYEYFIFNNIKIKNLEKNQEKFYEKLRSENRIHNNLNNEDILSIKENIKIDLVRKQLIEKQLNSQQNLLSQKTNSLDLIYNYNIDYLVIKIDEQISLSSVENIKNKKDLINLMKFLESNKINFLYKNEDINDYFKISTELKKLIDNNIKININIDDKFIKITSIEKNLESYEGVFVKLLNYRTLSKLNKEDLNCNNLKNLNKKIEFKEYEYTKLNIKIKQNLKSINDYIIIENDNSLDYIFLCELRYDEDILNSINFNKRVSMLAAEFQKKILNEYKLKFNFKNYYE